MIPILITDTSTNLVPLRQNYIGFQIDLWCSILDIDTKYQESSHPYSEYMFLIINEWLHQPKSFSKTLPSLTSNNQSHCKRILGFSVFYTDFNVIVIMEIDIYILKIWLDNSLNLMHLWIIKHFLGSHENSQVLLQGESGLTSSTNGSPSFSKSFLSQVKTSV